MNFYKLSDFKRKNFSKAINEFYNLTDYNHNQYPDYTKWFFGTNIPRILNNKGDIFFSLDGLLVKGIIIVKKTVDEKKICTALIDEPYRNQKLGSKLFEEAFKYLGTDKPIITIPKMKINQFEHFINYYNWKITDTINEYYSLEIKFN